MDFQVERVQLVVQENIQQEAQLLVQHVHQHVIVKDVNQQQVNVMVVMPDTNLHQAQENVLLVLL